MHYIISYSCISHIGNVRKINQDNLICDGHYIDLSDASIDFPLCGSRISDDIPVFGIFDGMGGEERGEIASYIAAKDASELVIGKDATIDLSQFCHKANDDICVYAQKNDVSAMGTTAAMLVFTNKDVVLCNIGDSKIFRLCEGILEQISKDHLAVSAFGVKPPLSQNLGIPPSEMIIEPYLARGEYNDGDIYLICSDGLTDMVPSDEITEVIISKSIDEASVLLLEKALARGGKDNTTIILCKVERQSSFFLKRKRYTKRKEV